MRVVRGGGRVRVAAKQGAVAETRCWKGRSSHSLSFSRYLDRVQDNSMCLVTEPSEDPKKESVSEKDGRFS